MRRTSVTLKLYLVTYLGLRHPEDRAVYFEPARKLNFDTRFPYLLLERILREDSVAAAGEG